MTSSFLDYWKTPIVQELKISERIRYCSFLFWGVMAVVFTVDFISGIPLEPIVLIISLVIKAFGYTLGIFMAEIAITYFSKRKNPFSGLSVGKAWIISFLGYVLGFLMLEPYRVYLGHLELHGSHSNWGFFLKISPVWAIMTYFYIQFHLNRSLVKELDHLQSLNINLQKLDQNQSHDANLFSEDASFPLFEIPIKETGQSQSVKTSDITHINVIEHYSYLHFYHEGSLKQCELKSPLKDIQALLPKDIFVQVHRAYLVNVQHIMKVRKIPRSYEIHLKNLEEPIAISRYRLSEVLPKLDQFFKVI